MGVDSKAVRFFLPAAADVLIGSKAGQGFEAFGEVVGDHEVGAMSPKPIGGVS